MKAFRADLDVRVPVKQGTSRKDSINLASLHGIMSLGINAYGKANRPQTPVKGIITGVYGEEAESYFRKKSEETLQRVSLIF